MSSERFCGAAGMRPESEKKNVTSTRGSATTARTMWLASSAEIESAKGRVDRVADIAVQRVVQDVADQEQGGKDEGRDHRCAVRCNAARADERIADEQRRGGKAVEDRIERGQKGVLRAGCRGGMNVDQPEQKQRSRGADGRGWRQWPGACSISDSTREPRVVMIRLVLCDGAEHQRREQQRADR